MAKPKLIGYATEFAPAKRLPNAELLRQHNDWAAQTQTNLVSNATPNLLLILNDCRQIVFANEQVKKLVNKTSIADYLGLRPGELLGCVHSTETEGGCGTTRFCEHCGAVKAMLMGLSGTNDIEECSIYRGEGLPPLNLRVFTTPVILNDEPYVIFSLQDISDELENKRLTEEVKKLATIDPLTGISNRRNFFEMANREFARSIRYGHQLSLAMLDIDDFKAFNDTYGHLVGDEVLINGTRLIASQLRDIDLFGRYGGDEFILLLPETDIDGARSITERLTQFVYDNPIKTTAGEFTLSITAGVSTLLPDFDKEFTAMVASADNDLYANKRLKHKS